MVSELLTLLIALVALVTSILSVYYSRVHVSTDFEVSQNIKRDTATLLSTLISLIHKGALYTQQDVGERGDPDFPNFVDIKHEISILQKFMTSPTAHAYISYAVEKSKEAYDKKQPEKWRNFGLDMASLLSESNPHKAAIQAAKILVLYFDFSETNSFEDIQKELKSLSDVITNSAVRLKEDMPITAVYIDMAQNN